VYLVLRSTESSVITFHRPAQGQEEGRREKEGRKKREERRGCFLHAPQKSRRGSFKAVFLLVSYATTTEFF